MLLIAYAGLGGSAVLCAAFPFYPADVRIILAVVAMLGVFAGVAFGSSYQLVSRFGARESVALTTGVCPKPLNLSRSPWPSQPVCTLSPKPYWRPIVHGLTTSGYPEIGARL